MYCIKLFFLSFIDLSILHRTNKYIFSSVKILFNNVNEFLLIHMEALKKQSRAVSAHSLMTGMFNKSEGIKTKI